MIKLDDVSIVDLFFITSFKHKLEYNILNSFNVTSFSQLSQLIENGSIVSEFLVDYYSKIIRCIDKVNELDRKPEIYLLDNYKNFGYDFNSVELLKQQDSKVLGSDLLYANPLGGVCVTNNKLKQMSIKDVKYFLEHCVVISTDYIGKNALRNERGFGIVAINKVLNSIEFYEKQVIRQLIENNNIICDNLFYKDYDKKVSIILDNLWEIVEYFVDNANECVWGKMTNFQKKELLGSLSSCYDNPLDKPMISRFVNCIANYTTVSELEKGAIKTKVLNRFIVK